MKIQFHKYQGTGNDFIMIDNRGGTFPKKDTSLVNRLCDRRFGIGADGLILIERDKIADFAMIYYNSDGRPGSMCGNGGRCAVAFARSLNLIGDKTTFTAADGLHEATIFADGTISLLMKDVDGITARDGNWFLDTGSPHHVQLVEALDTFDVFAEGSKIRNEIYGREGSNVNFVEARDPGNFSVRTFERGVEDETLSCGTGATAVALAMHASGKTDSKEVTLHVPGGTLKVSFDSEDNRYTNIWLTGPADFVFEGTIES